jgi:hypothetical protein
MNKMISILMRNNYLVITNEKNQSTEISYLDAQVLADMLVSMIPVIEQFGPQAKTWLDA